MTWLPPFLLVITASCVVWITFQQWIVARQKLNYDLFDRRFEVYTAVEKYLIICLNRNGGTHEDTGVFYQAIRIAPFFFDEDINEFLALLMRNSINIQIFSKYVEIRNTPEWQEQMDIYHRSQQWAAQAFTNLNAKFQKSINPSYVVFFPVQKIIQIPNPQFLRDKMLSDSSLKSKP